MHHVRMRAPFFRHDFRVWPDRRMNIETVLAGAFEELVYDGEAVDLIGSLKDAEDAGVAVGARQGKLLAVAKAAMNLQRLVNHKILHFGSVKLKNGALDGVLF